MNKNKINDEMRSKLLEVGTYLFDEGINNFFIILSFQEKSGDYEVYDVKYDRYLYFNTVGVAYDLWKKRIEIIYEPKT